MSKPIRPLVTVVMPVYNYRRFVREAVASVWTQDYEPVEIVAIDDGSTDGSYELLCDLSSQSPVPMHVLRGEHGGVCAAMNRGLDVARGKWVSVLHADDVYLPQKISQQVQMGERDPRVVLVHSEYIVIDENSDLVEGLTSANDRPPAAGDALRDILEHRRDVRSMTMFYRRETMLRIGPYDVNLPNEDWHSILLLCGAGFVAHADEALVCRRVHSQNRDINLTRRPEFSISEIAPDVLARVTPPDLDPHVVGARAVGTIIINSLAAGNRRKARQALHASWSRYPRGRRFLIASVILGARSRLWRYARRVLPDRWVRQLRRLRVR